MEAKNIQLQQKDGQLQQQGTELREKTNEIKRQQKELRTLRVRKSISVLNEEKMIDLHFAQLLGGQKKATGRSEG